MRVRERAAADQGTLNRAQRLRVELEAALSPAGISAALECGKGTNLEAVVRGLFGAG